MENQSKKRVYRLSATLREMMERHPHTGEKTTQKILGDAVGIRPQTVSLYTNGDTQPPAETLLKIADYFGVSVDRLLTGISAENTEICEELGISEDAVNMIKQAHIMDEKNGLRLIPLINDLFSEHEFYGFLEELTFKADNLKYLINQTPDEKLMRPQDIDIEGYTRWDIFTYVQEFVVKMLQKREQNICGQGGAYGK